MQRNRLISFLFFLVLLNSKSSSQINFDVNWTPYVTYYLSMVDINTGESNMPIFLATLERSGDAPDVVEVHIEFEIIIDSEALNVNNVTLVKLETTDPLKLGAPIQISNMDLNLSTDALYDNTGNPVNLSIDIT